MRKSDHELGLDFNIGGPQSFITDQKMKLNEDTEVELAYSPKSVPKTLEHWRTMARRYAILLFKNGVMSKMPCFACGYDGPGYYDPKVHRCAELHHKYHNPALRT